MSEYLEDGTEVVFGVKVRCFRENNGIWGETTGPFIAVVALTDEIRSKNSGKIISTAKMFTIAGYWDAKVILQESVIVEEHTTGKPVFQARGLLQAAIERVAKSLCQHRP